MVGWPMKTFLVVLIAICGFAQPVTVSAQDSEPRTQETQDRIDSFTRRMKDWGYYYGDLAGTENLWLSYDDEVVDETVLIGGGDWVVFDRRLCSGAYGVSHEDGSMHAVELVRPDDFDLTCFAPEITSPVDAITLMRRYKWFNGLFINWDHVLTPNPFGAAGWDGFADIDASYDSERAGLADDPHLALYWLMHFGFTLDARYDEVKALILAHDLASRLDVMNDAMAFFDAQSPYDDIEISNDYTADPDFEDIYLKRRAYMVFITRSYAYASGADGMDAWWHSIQLYPHAERYMIRRMRWLANNLKEHDQWQAFSDLLEQDPTADDISLLSYVRALNPLASDTERQQQAARFLEELVEHEQLWKNPVARRFGRVMIWDVREIVDDNPRLQAATAIYFADDTISEEFQDINVILNGAEANAKTAEVLEMVTLLEEFGDAFDRYQASDEERQDFWRNVDATLERAHADSDEQLFEVISNLRNHDVQERALRYLFTQDIAQKGPAFIDLFVRLEPNGRDIPDIFAGIFPQMFDGPNDANIAIIQQLLLLPASEHRNEWAAKGSREAATIFFLDSVHWPKNFEVFMALLQDPELNDLADLKEDLFNNLLSQEYDTKINPTHQMSQAQLEVMLDTISDVLRQPGWHEYGFAQEAIRAIYYMDNPLAKDWLERNLDNQEWLATFPAVDMGFDPLRVEINRAIGASLEFIEEGMAQ